MNIAKGAGTDSVKFYTKSPQIRMAWVVSISSGWELGNVHLCSQNFHARCFFLQGGFATLTSVRRLGLVVDQAPALCHP